MFLNKLKNTLNIKQDDDETYKKKIDISVLNGEEVNIYKKLIEKFRENVESIEELSRTNREDILHYIKQRQTQASNTDLPEEEQYNFADDMHEIKESLKDIFMQLKQIETIHVEIKNKVEVIEKNQSSENVKELQNTLRKYESQIKNYERSEENNREILNTLRQQTQLYSKEVKQLQEKSNKLEKQLSEKNTIIANLRQEKNVLLEISNNASSAKIPEMQAMKIKISESQKRLALEKTKVEQKQKQVENIRKKMEEDRESLQKIADQLKEKQLKSKKIVDKYERSKAQIRKFREEKTEFIKKLNKEVIDLNERLNSEIKIRQNLQKEREELFTEAEELKTEISKNSNRKIQLESLMSEMVQVRKQLHDKNVNLEQQKQEYNRLKQMNQQLQAKRKQLLEALEKPITHELKTLDKILNALNKLYKQYITTVFQEGNIVGFERRITYIVSNVQEIKEDLLL